MDTPSIPTSNYSPRFFNLGATNSGSLTRTDILPLTISEFEGFGNKEIEFANRLVKATIARMAGIRECPLADFLFSLKRPGNAGFSTPGSLVLPYDHEIQEHYINANYFKVVSSSATTGAGTNGIHPGSRDVILSMNTGTTQIETPLPGLERYFLPEMNVSIQFADGSSNAKTAFMKVVKAVNSDSGGVYRTTVTLEPNVSASAWSSLTAPQQALYEFTSGIAVRCGNSISDYESYPYQNPSNQSKTLLYFWHQTFRNVFEYDDLFLEALNAPHTNEYFRKFKTYPIAIHAAQQEMDYQNQIVNAAMFGDYLNENQTTTLFHNLPKVSDPANYNAEIHYKANMLGFKTILGNASRVQDRIGAALNLDTLFAEMYWIKRTREGANAMDHSVIDVHTNRKTASLIEKVMAKYYKDRFAVDSIQVSNVEYGTMKYGDRVMSDYRIYDIPDSSGVRFAVITQKYFDDVFHAHGSTSRGNYLWIPDASDMEIQVHDMASANRTTNENDELYRHIIKFNKRHTKLMSETLSTRLRNPNRHFMVENFSSALSPILTSLPGALV